MLDVVETEGVSYGDCRILCDIGRKGLPSERSSYQDIAQHVFVDIHGKPNTILDYLLYGNAVKGKRAPHNADGRRT